MLLLLLRPCNIVSSRVLWYLQHCSFCSILSWLLAVFCVFIWIIGLIFQSLWWMSLGFSWELNWTCRLLFTILILRIHEHGKQVGTDSTWI
jgi:hypothetical protein